MNVNVKMFCRVIISIWISIVAFENQSSATHFSGATITQIGSRLDSVAFNVTLQRAPNSPVSLYENVIELQIDYSCIKRPIIVQQLVRVFDPHEYPLSQIEYPSYMLQDTSMSRGNHNCEKKWKNRTRLDILDTENYIYELQHLPTDSTFELHITASYPGSRLRRENTIAARGVVYTESHQLPSTGEGFFWIRDTNISSEERIVTIFWPKIDGSARLVQYNYFNGTSKNYIGTIPLQNGFFTTSIGMTRSDFEITKISKNGTLEPYFKLISVPPHEKVLSTSASWCAKYIQESPDEGRVEWIVKDDYHQPMESRITDFLVFWMDYDNSIAFAPVSSENKGIFIRTKNPRAIGISARTSTLSSGLILLHGFDFNNEMLGNYTQTRSSTRDV